MDLDKLLNNIYRRFFLRDIISIIFPGIIVLCSLVTFFPDDTVGLFVNYKFIKDSIENNTIFYILLASASYFIGLFINLLRDFLIYHFLNKFFFKYASIEDYHLELMEFYVITETEKFRGVSESRERAIVLMQTLGNTCLAFIILLLIVKPELIWFIIIASIGFLFSIYKYFELVTFTRAAVKYIKK